MLESGLKKGWLRSWLTPKDVVGNYDPWGLNLVGIETTGQPDHKFQYNGKEKQSELGLNWSDYGFRNYDSQLGRWHAVDPVSDWAESLSPYRYGLNNPVNHIDLLGLWEATAGGYKTDKKDEIERFMNYLQAEQATSKNSPSAAQMGDFIKGEMSGQGGRLSDGSKLLSAVNVQGYQDGRGTRWYTDQKTYDRAWNEVQSSLGGDGESENGFSYRHFIGPGMGLLAMPIPKRMLGYMTVKGASEYTSLFSLGMSKLLPMKMSKRLFTHYNANGVRISTNMLGRYIGRWGTKILGRVSGPIMIADIFYTSYDNFQNATPQEQQYMINPWGANYLAYPSNNSPTTSSSQVDED